MSWRCRSIVKVLCSDCSIKLNTECKNCTFLKYNNVTNLKSFNSFLDNKFPSWIFFKVYEYKPGEKNGRLLDTFIRNKHLPGTKTI